MLKMLNDRIERDELYKELEEEFTFRDDSWEDYTEIIGSLAQVN